MEESGVLQSAGDGTGSASAYQRAEYRRSGWWGTATLKDWFSHAVKVAPDRVAVQDRLGKSLTYRELDMSAARLARWITDAGVGAGEIVTVQLPNWVEFTVAFAACLKVGAVINPVPTNLRARDLKQILSVTDSPLLISPRHYRHTNFENVVQQLQEGHSTLKNVLYVSESVGGNNADALGFGKEVRERSPLEDDLEHDGTGSDLATVLFTSGSEAEPKGVMLSHDNIIAAERSFAQMLNIGVEDRMFMPAPVGHATGFLHGVVMPIITQTTSLLCDRTSGADMLAMIRDTGATGGMAVPSVADSIVDACEQDGGNPGRMRFFCCGGSPVPRQLVKRARSYGLRLYSVYGSTESAPHAMTTFTDDDEHVINTDGRGCPGVDIRIVDPATRQTLSPGEEGEQASRGPHIFMGYLHQPELTRKVLDDDGWYYSGDLAVMDEEGYIRITGRIKDIIIRGGENIAAAEIEGLLREHPRIREAAVVAMPDELLGQRACAYIVSRDPADKFTVEMLREWFIEIGVAKFKIPERVVNVEEMPRTNSGKVAKGTLRTWATEFCQSPDPLGSRTNDITASSIN